MTCPRCGATMVSVHDCTMCSECGQAVSDDR